MTDLGARLRKGMDGLIDGVPGETGKLNADGSYTIRVEDTLNEVYVRLGGDPLRTVTAINNSTAYKARLPVRLRYTTSGRYEIIKVDPLPALLFLGEASGSANIPPLIGDAIDIILNSTQFRPGRVRPLNGLDLQIIVEEFPYPEKLLGGADTITDLTTIVGTIGSGKKAWTAISIDPTDNTISVTKGTDTDPTDELTWADAAAIAVPSGTIPLAAYMMQDGDTTLPDRPVEQDQYFYVDLRPWLTATSGVVESVTSVSTNTTLTTSMYVVLVTATATITLPNAVTNLGRHYVVKNMSAPGTVTIDTTSSQTIDGNLTLVITDQYVSVTLCSDGANWVIL